MTNTETGSPVTVEELAAAEKLTAELNDDGWEWAIVEVMGFRKHVGRVREVEKYGAKMLRVDVPIKGDPVANGWETHLYSGSALFGVTPTDEASAMKANKPYEPPALTRWRDSPAEHEHHDSTIDEIDDEIDEGED
jgi:hypothetical protein